MARVRDVELQEVASDLQPIYFSEVLDFTSSSSYGVAIIANSIVGTTCKYVMLKSATICQMSALTLLKFSAKINVLPANKDGKN